MPKFKKKPVIISAERWFKKGDVPEVVLYSGRLQMKCDICGQYESDHGIIGTLEGSHIVCPGDWIITGIHGYLSPCKPDIFEKTYERVED